MALNQSYKKSDTKEYFLIPEDSHVAILYSAIDLGDQQTGFPETDDEDKPIPGTNKVQSRVRLTFELQDVLMADGRPAVIGEDFNVSLHELARLRPILEAALGGGKAAKDLIESEDEDVGSLLKKSVGKAVLLSVIHKPSKKTGVMYANIGSATALPSALKSTVKKGVNDTVYVGDVNTIDQATLDKIPAFIKAKIAVRLNGPQSKAANDSESPF
jgi:hypothetical protein